MNVGDSTAYLHQYIGSNWREQPVEVFIIRNKYNKVTMQQYLTPVQLAYPKAIIDIGSYISGVWLLRKTTDLPNASQIPLFTISATSRVESESISSPLTNSKFWTASRNRGLQLFLASLTLANGRTNSWKTSFGTFAAHL